MDHGKHNHFSSSFQYDTGDGMEGGGVLVLMGILFGGLLLAGYTFKTSRNASGRRDQHAQYSPSTRTHPVQICPCGMPTHCMYPTVYPAATYPPITHPISEPTMTKISMVPKTPMMTKTPGQMMTMTPGQMMTMTPMMTKTPGQMMTMTPMMTKTPGQMMTMTPGQMMTMTPGQMMTMTPRPMPMPPNMDEMSPNMGDMSPDMDEMSPDDMPSDNMSPANM